MEKSTTTPKRSFIRNIKLVALKAIIDPDTDAFIRHVHRWYSKNFNTPLHIVPDLPTDDVFLAYFETKYEQLKEDDDESLFVREMVMATETEEERKTREMKEAETEASDEEYLKEVLAEEKAKGANKIENIKPTQKTPIHFQGGHTEAALPKGSSEPIIKMEFISEEELDEQAGWDPLGISSRPHASPYVIPKKK